MELVSRLGTALAVAAALGGCSEATGPDGIDEGVNLAWEGGTHRASGAPSFSGQEVDAETFAIAFADSLGGVVVASFELKQGTTGDLFILQLVEAATGTFDCGPGNDCHGRLLEGIDATNPQSVETYWEIEAGTATVETLTDDRITGELEQVVLLDGDTGATRPILTGTFDLEILTESDGVDILRCFLARITGGSC